MAKVKEVKFPYVLVHGYHHELDENGVDVRHEEGAVLQMTEAKAKAFAPKFRALAEIQAESEIAKRTAEVMQQVKDEAEAKKAGELDEALELQAKEKLALEEAEKKKIADAAEAKKSLGNANSGNPVGKQTSVKTA